MIDRTAHLLRSMSGLIKRSMSASESRTSHKPSRSSTRRTSSSSTGTWNTRSSSGSSRWQRRQLPLTLLLLLLPAMLLDTTQAEKDPRTCGNREGAICCQSWGNTCIDNSLTCCNNTCIATPYNSSHPEAACGISMKPVCTFNKLLLKTSKFNSANAFVMAALAKAVYPDAWALPDNDTLVGSAFSTWVKAYGISNATFINARNKLHEVDTEGVCMRDDDGNVFVVFRGTSSRGDVGTDADFFGSFHPEHNNMFGKRSVQLHDGFTDAYYYVRDQTKKCVSAYMDYFAALREAKLHENATNADKSTSKPMLWVGGHSLGAALAHLAAADLAQMGYLPVTYTIGSPRVGDRDWVKLYNEELGLKNRTYRMVNENDPVARVPVTLLGYRHVGTPVDLNATRGSCEFLDETPECEPHCKVEDHYTDYYMNATYQCMKNEQSIDLEQCPQDRLQVVTNYDLKAAAPGEGTLANESDAILAAAANQSSTSSAGSVAHGRGQDTGYVMGAVIWVSWIATLAMMF